MNYRLIVTLLFGFSLVPTYISVTPDALFSPEELLTIAKKADTIVSSTMVLSEEEALLLTNYFYVSYMLAKSDRIVRLHLNTLSKYYRTIKTDIPTFLDTQETMEKMLTATHKLKDALQLRNRIFDLYKHYIIKFDTDQTIGQGLKTTLTTLATQHNELCDMFLAKYDSNFTKQLLTINEKLNTITGELQNLSTAYKALSTGKSPENPNEKITPLTKFYSAAILYSPIITNSALLCLENAESFDNNIMAFNDAEIIIHAMHYNKMIQSLTQRKITPLIMANGSGEIPVAKRTEKLPDQLKI